ncbi:MAG: putative 4-hydroxybenzoate polyprenyltransferase [Candidatus Dadabacteria bacterium]|nr:putative 4-hydroxybenzoate polyprenyltransferase [Candidatus Dadabacteria bacterium]
MTFLKNLSGFLRIEHTFFSLPLIFAGAFLAADGIFSAKLFVLIVFAGTGARTLALALNRIFDRAIDRENPRTEKRELPSGKIRMGEAIVVAAAGALLYFVSAYLICPLVLILSPLPLVAFTVYPLMKRFTSLCHFGVGFSLALSPLGGWLAVRCSFEEIFPAVLLSAFTFLWISGFDIIYATADEEFDRRRGIYSLVARFGRRRALIVSRICHMLSFGFLVFLYLFSFRTFFAFPALLLCGYLLYLEHRSFGQVDSVFFRTNILIGFAVLFFTLMGIYLP